MGSGWVRVGEGESVCVVVDPRGEALEMRCEKAKVVAKTIGKVAAEFDARRVNRAISWRKECVNVFAGQAVRP